MIAGAMTTTADGTAEPDAVLLLLREINDRRLRLQWVQTRPTM